MRTDETAQVAWPHVRLDGQVARHRRADAKILLKAICVFDGLVVTAHKAEVGLEVEVEFGPSVVALHQDKAGVKRIPSKRDDR